jgi:radical SAM-linked protein
LHDSQSRRNKFGPSDENRIAALQRQNFKELNLPQHWALWLSVEGDLRFLSHHDVMREMQRLCTRAGIPLRYSQGFNPHPVMSIACPRPVGVASLADVVVMDLDDTPEPLSPEDIIARANATAPQGMKFTRAENLQASKTLHPRKIQYQLAIWPEEVSRLSARLEELSGMPVWTVARRKADKAGRGRFTHEDLDIHQMVADLKLEGLLLGWTQVPAGEVWARPGEVLELIGLDARVDLARLKRMAVQYE